MVGPCGFDHTARGAVQGAKAWNTLALHQVTEKNRKSYPLLILCYYRVTVR